MGEVESSGSRRFMVVPNGVDPQFKFQTRLTGFYANGERAAMTNAGAASLETVSCVLAV
jgi:hypothetical protein